MTVRFFTRHAFWALSLSLCARASVVEVGTTIEIRLQQEINSFSTKEGASFQAVVISPLIKDGVECIPAGTIAHGVVDRVRKVGLGLVRERASIGLAVRDLELPDGRRLPVSMRLWELDNAREAIDSRGRIRGIRSTNTPGYRATSVLVSLASVEPIALLFSTTAFATILRFSEPEIRLPAGTELKVQFAAPVETGTGFENLTATLSQNADERKELQGLVQRLPYRTKTKTGIDSDITNIVFIGNVEGVARAFEAAGWNAPQTVNAATRYRTLRALAESQEYREAPMSPLLLEGEDAVLSRSKSLNSFARRHHIRVFSTGQLWYGETVLTASATQDSGISFSMRDKSFVHVIDSRIDRERAKVIDDLVFTGCVDAVEIITRPWIPRDARNATGDLLITDSNAAVLRINECKDAHRSDHEITGSPGPYRGNNVARLGRRFFLTARNDLIRGSLVYQGISATTALARLVKRKGEGPLPIDASRPFEMARSNNDPPQIYERLPLLSFIAPIDATNRQGGPAVSMPGRRVYDPETEARRWVPPHMELSINFGRLEYGSQSTGAEGLLIRKQYANGDREQATVLAGNTVKPGWLVGGTLTVNSHRWISHELGFQYQRGAFELDLSSPEPGTTANIKSNLQSQRTGLLTRQFSYNTILQLRPKEQRWSPYLAAGPSLQLMHLTGAPFRNAKGMFRLGLTNVGMLEAAYNFGQAPPLEGGGIFLPGIQYGGGIKYRVQPRWTVRVDFRNTVSKQPDFLTKSLAHTHSTAEGMQVEVTPIGKTGLLNQRRFTTGLAFTF
jgi:hypothetical protein